MDMQVRLTQFSHGGGCGCKIAPGVLEKILAKSAPGLVPKQLLVGIETADDAAVYQINDTQAIVATTDFFMPIVDDPFDFGAIAATNAISDVYAMGGQPLFALALVGMPVDKLPVEMIRRILEGGESVCARAGIPIAGGHTIDSVEPIYGLVAIGLVDPRNLKRNAGAKAGDKLVLGKPLGVGIYSAALKTGRLGEDGLRGDDREHHQAQYARPEAGPPAGRPRAHRRHRASACWATSSRSARARAWRRSVDWDKLPVLPGALELAREGFTTGASEAQFRRLRRQGLARRRPSTRPARPCSPIRRRAAGCSFPARRTAVDEVLRIFARRRLRPRRGDRRDRRRASRRSRASTESRLLLRERRDEVPSGGVEHRVGHARARPSGGSDANPASAQDRLEFRRRVLVGVLRVDALALRGSGAPGRRAAPTCSRTLSRCISMRPSASL